MPMSSSLYAILCLTPVLFWATQTNSALWGFAMGEGLHRPDVVALPLHLPCQDWVCGVRVVDDDHVGQEGALALTAGPEACLTMRLTSLDYGQAQALASV